MARGLATSLFLGSLLLAVSGCESAEQKEAKRINELYIQNCLTIDDTNWCSKVKPDLTSEKEMEKVQARKQVVESNIVKKVEQREEQKSLVSNCLSNKSEESCNKVDLDLADSYTSQLVIDQIATINKETCLNDGELKYCRKIDISLLDEKEAQVVKEEIEKLERIEKDEAIAALIEDANNDNEKALEKLRSEAKAGDKNASMFITNWDARIEREWKELTNNADKGDEKALDLLIAKANQGDEKAKEFLEGWRERKRQQEYLASLKPKRKALREICEAGDEYRRDGFGTPQQIAHELAYWVIDLHKETGGKASEGELKNAGSQGYVYGNCSMY